ncbi:MAG: hypothetical protein HY690_08800 [Chloroflexi bacterium]|nr:hypothetical protein [Chloroflexota bacterium]
MATALIAVALLGGGALPTFAQTAPPARDIRFGIAEGHKSPLSKQVNIGWERLTFGWSAIQPGGPNDWRADFAFTPQMLQNELASGVQVVGLLQFTPPWAQANPADGQRSVPRNLNLPWDHQDNYWGQFTRRMAKHYAGRINQWVVWNEPEIRNEDPGGGSSWTWGGGPAEYYQLLKVAYRNIKAGNPNATVTFAGTSYWLDQNAGRQQFFRRVLDVAAGDPEAAANGFFFDVASFNIYRAPDDLYRIYFEMKDTMRTYGLDKPLWITETNAMPYDPSVPCADRYHPTKNPSNVPLDVQADYTIQGLALSLAAGWDRVEWYQMVDSNTCNESAIWGLARDDGTLRPAFQAFKTAVNYFAGFNRIAFKPLGRWDERWAPWPRSKQSYYPNWQVYQVVMDRGSQRVTVLWNSDASPLRVRIPSVGTSARLVNKAGQETPLTPVANWLVVDLKPASARGPFDPDGYFYIGGEPLIIVQEGVPADSPIIEPRLGDPGSATPDFRIEVSPAALVAAPGGAVTFSVRTQGLEGFAEPVSLRLASYSTQRFPDPVDTPPQTITPLFPENVALGESSSITIQTQPDVEPGIHYFSIEASGGGIAKTFDVVVQIEG